MQKPAYIKVSNFPPKNPWPVVNEKKIEILKKIGKKFGQRGNSLYLIGSAAGREEADKVNDLDLIIVVEDPFKLYSAEKLSRQYKKIKGINLPVTYQFLPFDWIEGIGERNYAAFWPPVFFTYVKVNNICLGGKNIIGNSRWLSREVVKADGITRVKQAILGLFKEINKERFTKEQNYLVLKYIREIMVSSMFAQFYFGFSKTELFSLFLEKYHLKNNWPAKLLFETRQYGRDHFVNQDPEKLQNETLLFAQEMWGKMGKL